jgi:hypothetical protein
VKSLHFVYLNVISYFKVCFYLSQPVLLQMSMSICNKWSVLQLNLAVLFCLQQTFTLDSHVSIFPELNICMLWFLYDWLIILFFNIPGENQWKIIKTLYYIEVLGCLSPLLAIFQMYHSTWSSVLWVEENGKNHRAGFELTTLYVPVQSLSTKFSTSSSSNVHVYL